MGRALSRGGPQKGCMGCWRSVAVEKDKGSTLGSIPTAAPGAQRPQPHTVGPRGRVSGGMERLSVCTPIAHALVCTRGSDEGSTGPSCSLPPPEQRVGGAETPIPTPACIPPHGHVRQHQVPPIRWDGGSQCGEGDVDGFGGGGKAELGGLRLDPGLAVLRVGTKQWNVREDKSDTKAAESWGCR